MIYCILIIIFTIIITCLLGWFFAYDDNIHREVSPKELEEYINSYANTNLHKLIDVNKLIAILYVVQGVFLAKYNRALFDEDFETWISGPVLPSVYRRNKVYGGYIPYIPGKFINAFDEIEYKGTKNFIDKFSSRQLNDLNSIIEQLMPYEGYSLLQKFKEDPPYINNYKYIFYGDEHSIIPKKDLKKYFKENL